MKYLEIEKQFKVILREIFEKYPMPLSVREIRNCIFKEYFDNYNEMSSLVAYMLLEMCDSNELLEDNSNRFYYPDLVEIKRTTDDPDKEIVVRHIRKYGDNSNWKMIIEMLERREF